MALINNYYVQVTDEQVKREISLSDHPVETGLPVTDNVKRQPLELSLSGYIVDVGNQKAHDIMNKLHNYMNNGNYVRYIGRNLFENCLITSFQTTHTNEVRGGCEFSMDIKQVRIAAKAYNGYSAASTQQVTKKSTSTARYYTVKAGDCLWNIAKKYYGNGSKYPKIYEANKKMIDTRNQKYSMPKYTIYPKQVFLIPY